MLGNDQSSPVHICQRILELESIHKTYTNIVETHYSYDCLCVGFPVFVGFGFWTCLGTVRGVVGWVVGVAGGLLRARCDLIQLA